ncbi:unnamed protein product [Danaus chrysippus]|uniref:Large ribosomal subunit protein uL1 n=1 Tax=Danaus chrysippus TaxID=151541 RepID=A0A8J2W7S0_9NEOP|nr:unnamed protein product [Danaus chrysippus]
MEFFGITLYGPQNFIKDTLRSDYEEPMSKEEVKPLMERIIQNSTMPEKILRPDVDAIRLIDCYIGRVNGFAYGSSQRFIKMKRKGVIKPVGPADMYRIPPSSSNDYGWFHHDPEITSSSWHKTFPRRPQPTSPNTLILDIVRKNNKYATLSKVSRDTLYECVNAVLQSSKDKKRNFLETVELQIGLKNYDPQKDKRFSGTVKLKYIPRPKMQVCVLGDQQHCDEAKSLTVPCMDAEALKKLNKNKKLVKKLAKKYDAFLASESLIKQIPRLLGPGLNKAGKFPGLLSHQESMTQKIDEVKATIKFQMKKVLCLSVAVGHVDMTPDELAQNVHLSINFLVSLLKKHWQNVRSLHMKSTMGPPQRLY